MEAIILAGGFGARLREAVADVPKPMAPIGGKPFLCYLLDDLSARGARRVILSVGYKHEAIEDYFGSDYRGLAIVYAVESDPLGTGGALREALRFAQEESLLVLNGDSFFDVDLQALLDFHRGRGGLLTLALKSMRHFDRYGTVVLDGDRVVGFREKARTASGYINAGVYAVDAQIAGLLNEYIGKFSFEEDFLQNRVSQMEVSAFLGDGYFVDIGLPKAYRKAQQELESILGTIKR